MRRLLLNRPQRLNAIDDALLAALDREIAAASEDASTAVIVLAGRGRSFCAGADLGAGGDAFDVDAGSPATGSGRGRHRDEGGLLTLRIFRCTKPVIAAINGPAVGVGATMTLPMDIRLASDQSKFGFVFARRGIVPEACSSWFLPRLVGISQAAEWCYSGRVFPASEALDGGLVRSVHAADDLLPAARAIAREIADNTAPVSVALTRQMLWRMLGASMACFAHAILPFCFEKTGSTTIRELHDRMVVNRHRAAAPAATRAEP